MLNRIKTSFGFRVGRWNQLRTAALRHEQVQQYFRSKHQIHTYTTPEELLMLSEYAAKIPAESAIVEIGSYVGASTRYLLYGSRNSSQKLVCIDTWRNETMPDGNRDTLAEFSENLEPNLTKVILLRGDSKEFTSDSLPITIGMAFIDGDHSYEAVCHDLSLVLPNLCKGGFIAFHDIVYFRGVSRCVGELLAKGDYKIVGYTGNLLVVKREEFNK